MKVSVWSQRVPGQRRSPRMARDLLRRAVAQHAGRDVPVEHRSGHAPWVRGLAVSLSRTEDVAMCAVAGCERIGIDIERLEPGADYSDIAPLLGRSVREDAPMLLATWCRKEALAKAMGTGLPEDVRTLVVPGTAIEIGTWMRADGWLWIGCPCETGCVASLVVRQDGENGTGLCDMIETRADPAIRTWSLDVGC